MATAIGNQSSAEAAGGSFDSSSANGFATFAFTGGGDSNFDVASVSGTHSTAEAGHGSYDSTNVIGDFSRADSGFDGSFDSATLLGSNSTANAEIGFGDSSLHNRLCWSWQPRQRRLCRRRGDPRYFDLAGIFGDGLIAHSIGDFIAHIAPYFYGWGDALGFTAAMPFRVSARRRRLGCGCGR